MINAENVRLGRPRGRKKTAKIEISIEPEIKDSFMKLLQSEGKCASMEICSWIRQYIREHSNEVNSR